MILYLIRHCRTDFNDQRRCQGTTDLSLNKGGRIEAETLLTRFAGMRLDAIHSSPYKRAMETALSVAGDRELEMVMEPGLAELDQGDLEGMDMLEMTAEYPNLIKEWFLNPADTEMPGGSETMRMLQERAWKSIQSIIGKYDREMHVAAVSHNLTLCTILCKVLNLPISDFRRLKVSNGGISMVDFGARWPVAISINDTSHIEGV